MKREELLKRLEEIEQQLWKEMELVTRQREMLTNLAAKGIEIEPAKMLLGRLEHSLLFSLQEREKLRAQLAKPEEL